MNSQDRLHTALTALPPRPISGTQPEKKNYSQLMSTYLAESISEELRLRGMAGTRPSSPGTASTSGAERRLSGGLGAKMVDITWTTEESGLILGISIKTINFRDGTTNNYQKNLINRRNDMLIEAVSLHRRFPYSVLVGMLFLDAGAEHDGTGKRKSTFENAFPRLRLFTGRDDPAGRDEQFERLYLALIEANRFNSSVRFFEVNDSTQEVSLDQILQDIVETIVVRNFDFYESLEPGTISRSN